MRGQRKRYRLLKYYFSGSYTVEASLVVSICVLVLGALLLCSFVVHDRAVLQASVCEMAAAGTNFTMEKERNEAVSKVKNSMKGSRLLGSRGLSGYATTGSKEALAFWNAVYPLPGFAAKYFAGGSADMSVKWSEKRICPAELIRRIRGAEEVLTGGE